MSAIAHLIHSPHDGGWYFRQWDNDIIRTRSRVSIGVYTTKAGAKAATQRGQIRWDVWTK